MLSVVPAAKRSCSRRCVATQASFGASAVPAASAPAPSTEVAQPPAIYQRVAELGEAKAVLPLGKLILLGLLAGFYVSFGGLLMLNIGISCPNLATTNPGLARLVTGCVGLPFGLIMVLVCGAELFTGNTCMLATAMYEGRCTPAQLLRNWAVSFTANLVASVALCYLVVAAGVAPALTAASAVAIKKTSLTFTQAFLRGIIANWLVNIAVWQATASTSLPGKVLGAIIPVTTFVGIGVEHSVANMSLIPLAIILGAPITWKQFLLGNLLPVTLGNIVGGAICVAGAYSFIHGRNGGVTA